MKSRIKPLFVLIVLGMLMVLPGQIFADAGVNYSVSAAAKLTGMNSSGTATIKAGALNVRSGPGVSFGVVAVVYQGQSVYLLGRNADSSWVRIKLYNGEEGWVNSTLIAPSVAISTLPVIVATSTAHVNAGNLNVRSGPAVTYNSIAVIGHGDAVTLLGRNSDATWVKVRIASGAVGWINSTKISTPANIYALPVEVIGSGPGPTATVATGALNIRTGPGANHPLVATLGYGQPVVLLGRTADSGWAMVRVYNGAVGWANAAYLQSPVNFANLPIVGGGGAPSGPTPPASGPATGIIATGALNIRSGPSIGHWVVTVATSGQQVVVHGRSSSTGWLKVSIGGHTGWANGYYIQTSVPNSQLPALP